MDALSIVDAIERAVASGLTVTIAPVEASENDGVTTSVTITTANSCDGVTVYGATVSDPLMRAIAAMRAGGAA